MSKPLDGVKVVDLTQYVSGPSATRLLADYGAEVIKIENFGGDMWRQFSKDVCLCGDEDNLTYDGFNINKKSIVLDIKSAEGKEVLFRLLDRADVFVSNVRMKSLVKLGLDYKSLSEKYPKLIYGHIDGFGPEGPDAQAPSFDNYGYWVRSGFVRDMAAGGPDYYPVSTPSSVGDIATGTNLVTGVLAALYGREKTGKGDFITTSLYSAGIWSLSSMIMRADPSYLNEQWPREKCDIRFPFSRYYQCSDGEWIYTQGLRDNTFPRLVELLGVKDAFDAIGATSLEAANAHPTEVMNILLEAYKKNTAEYWTAAYRKADIVGGRLPHFKDILTDPQALANNYVQDYTCRAGKTFKIPCPPVHFASMPDMPQPTCEMPGESTDEVLEGLGYSKAEIENMKEKEAVK